ncbi:MAG: calcium/sodium antiporter [Gammaproteobacteria bacterium]|nr:calcium/sodium antiporter [Gammaproteobacteria bacterium]
MLLAYLAVLAGFAFLVWGADRFVIGASATARNLGIPPLIIGLTIVGFATSAPEMLVSGMAAWGGNTSMGIGNAVGSNITNIALVLGITALVKPMTVHSSVLQREFPILFLATLFMLTLMLDGELSRLDGILMMGGLILIVYWIVMVALQTRKKDPMSVEFEAEIPSEMSNLKAMGLLLLGIIVLLISSRVLVWGAVEIAVSFGISDLVIGLTIIAIGTSLPELAASVMSALKGEHDIAIGNIIGSNMFNILGVMGLPAIISGYQAEAELFNRDLPVMLGLTITLFVLAYGFRGTGRLNRYEGSVLLSCYAIYMLLLANVAIF